MDKFPVFDSPFPVYRECTGTYLRPVGHDEVVDCGQVAFDFDRIAREVRREQVLCWPPIADRQDWKLRNG